MRHLITLSAVAVALAIAPAASAAPTITSAAVTGPTGTVWDTTVNSFYTLFIQRPVGTILNPNDNFAGAALTNPVNGDYSFSLDGDGFPTAGVKVGKATVFPNSDPYYTLTLQLTEGSKTGTLSGTWTPSAFLFVTNGSSFTSSSGTYSLDSFDWSRTTSNNVGQFSSTNTTYNKLTSPGSGRDYKGTFAINVSPVPEPATWGMMILGFGIVGMALRARRRRQGIASLA